MFKFPSAPLVLALLLAALLGTLLGLIVTAPGHIRGLRVRRGLQNQVDSYERAAVAASDAVISKAR